MAKKTVVSPVPPADPEPAAATAVSTPPPPIPSAVESKPADQGGPMIKSKGIAILVSLILPGVGLALSNPKRVIEGVVVFLIALALDVAIVLYAVVGGPAITALLAAVTGGMCCFLGPLIWIFTLLGLVLIPIVHILGAVHTWLRY